MIKGQPAQLTVDQQLTVATWAAMKAAVFEYAWSEDTILTAADRDVIRTKDRPPASVQVRLAAIESVGSPLRARGVAYVDNGTGEKIICLTLTIGCLVVQVFGGPGAGTYGLQTSSMPRTDRIRIFPPATNTVQWPPPVALNDQTLPAFENPVRRCILSGTCAAHAVLRMFTPMSRACTRGRHALLWSTAAASQLTMIDVIGLSQRRITLS
jgi:hypothetical protein